MAEDDVIGDKKPLGYAEMIALILSMPAVWRAAYADARVALPGAEFENAVLSWADLSNMSLPRANFRGAQLRGVRLNGSDLTDACFAEANIEEADLTDADVLGANFQDSTGTPIAAPVTLAYIEAQRATYYMYLQAVDASGRGHHVQLTRGEKKDKLLSMSAEEWNAWRAQNPEQLIRLEAVNLAGQNLSGRDLSNAILIGVQLEDANLTGADLTGADLTRADLTKATLDRAKLVRASLGEAVLNGASCEGADFSWAKLEGATMNGLKTEGANFHGSTDTLFADEKTLAYIKAQQNQSTT